MTSVALDIPSVERPGLAIASRVMGFLASTFATATLMVFFC